MSTYPDHIEPPHNEGKVVDDKMDGEETIIDASMSQYDFTPEESRAVSKKFDWHVSASSHAVKRYCSLPVDLARYLVVLPVQLARSFQCFECPVGRHDE